MKKLLSETCRRRLGAAIAMLLLFVCAVSAQNKRIAGSVVDGNGDPLPGATISVVGNKDLGTTTDINGKFSIDVPQNAVLQFSFIGYKPHQVRAQAANDHMSIMLTEDSQELDDVVVTALGISREAKSLGYARQSVDTESLLDARDANLLNSLSGKVSGVNIISNGGPMASTRVEIRGNNSITGNNQPLYVVDGVPILNDMGESGNLDYGNPASFISPDDVESIEVLKGANAAALYGSAAANGVILITTKKATKRPGIGISYDYNMQFSFLREFPTYQNIYGTAGGDVGRINMEGVNYWGNNPKNGYEYNPDLPYGIFVANWKNHDQRSWGLPMLGFDIVGRNNEIRKYSPAEKSITDMYETGLQITNSVSVDKVFNGAAIRLSYTGIIYDGILKNFNDMKRHNFSANANAELAKWLSFDMSLNYQLEESDNRDYKGDSSQNPLRAVMNMPRDATLDELLPYKQEDGSPMSRGNGFYNPYWLINECDNADDRNSFRGIMTFYVKPFKGLTLRLRGAMERINKKGWTFDNYYSMWDIDGKYEMFSEASKNDQLEAVAIYDHRWNNGISLNASLGTSYEKNSFEQVRNTVNSLAVPDVPSLANNASIVTASQSYSGKEKQGVFGTASIGWNGAYIDGSIRNDWSSTLPMDNNSYLYWSVSGAWVLTDMFPKLKSNVLSFVKLRGSYAEVGNDAGFDRLYNSYSYGGVFRTDMAWYTGDNTRKNPNLKPETTTSAEVGAELHFLNDRLTFDVTYYSKSTRDQIVESQLSYLSNYQRVMINSGEVSNKGWELSISGTPIRTKQFEWRTTLNWSKNNSMVESLPDGIDRIEIGSGPYDAKTYVEVGKPYGVMYVNKFKRNEKGQILCDSRGLGLQDPEQQCLGTVQADWRGGWQNTFRYGNLSASVMIDFQKGGMYLSQTALQGAVDGLTVQSLYGRNEEFFSRFILNENDEERQGYLNAEYGAGGQSYVTVYPDWARPKGIQLDNCVYDESAGPELAGKPVTGAWVAVQDYWTHNTIRDISRFVYDASYIKLREITLSYDFPKKWFAKTPIQSLRISAVGRNVATLFANCPKGLDPQATNTTGNAQGYERGFNLPEATYGFDIKVTF